MYGPNNIFWNWLSVGPCVRPSRLTPRASKGEDYDANNLRFLLAGVQQPFRDAYLREYAANLTLVQNEPGSWGTPEQIREFLGDVTTPTGRMRWRRAVMQPMHTRLVGAGDNISISSKAVSWTSNVNTRMEGALYERLLKSQAAAMGGPLGEVMAEQGVSPDEEEEEGKFYNLWTDPYEKAISNLMTAMAKRQRLRGMQRKAASNLALSGVAAIHSFVNGNNIEAVLCDPAEVGWDSNAQKPDFSDGSFCYHTRLMDVADIAEQYQPARQKLLAIDRWTRMNSNVTGGQNGWPQQYPRVFTGYYKDMEQVERGFVLKDGEPHFCTINAPNPELRDGTPEYTDKDLITPPENRWTTTWTDQEWKQKKQIKWIQVLRYCVMIPWEYMPGAYTKGEPFHKRKGQLKADDLALVNNTGDMVLESGEYPLQEYDPDDRFTVEFPIKFGSWMYLGGRALAPLSCVRDIQSMMNATLSDMLMRMSRAEMPTTVFDDMALSAAGVSSDEAVRNLKQGKSFGIRSQLVGGINQAIKTTETGLGNEFYQRFAILDKLYQMAQDATGIYDQNFGAPGGEDMLVRVKELQNRQSGVMLAPFYGALSDLFEQQHQLNVQGGKRFFAARPWALNQMVGNEGERAILMSKEMTAEQFRVEVVLTPDAETRKEEANQMAMQDLQFGLLDAKAAAEVRGRSFKEDVFEAERRFTKRMAEAQKLRAQEEQKQQAAMMAGQQSAQLDQQEHELAMKSVDTGIQQEQMARKAEAPLVQAASEWMKPMEQDMPQGMPQPQPI